MSRDRVPGPSDLPDIYFESTIGKFTTAPLEVKRLGGLSKRWKTTEINRMEAGLSGGYMAWDAHRRPHCQEPRSKRKSISDLAKRSDSKLIIIPAETNHVKPGDLIVINHGTPDYEKVFPVELLRDLSMRSLFEDLLDRMMKPPKGSISSVSDRGNLAVSSGWSVLNLKLKGDKDVTSPQILATTSIGDVRRMIAVTSIIRRMSKFYSFPEPFSSDRQRTNEFANYLCEHFDLPSKDKHGNPCNTIEGLTCALTCCDPPPINGAKTEPFLFGTHIDQFNCAHPGFNALFCYYEHFQKEGRWYRVCVIGYSRSVVSQFFRRKDSKNFLKNNVKRYVQHCFKNGRGTAPIDVIPLPLEEVKEMDLGTLPTFQTHHRVPFMDKLSGFYSPVVSALSQLANRNDLSLETFCELLLPIGWATTFTNIYPLLMHWCDTGLPVQSNLTVSMITELVERNGSFVAGAGPRFQPSFNFSVPMKDLKGSLKILRDVIIDINEGKLSMSDKELKTRMGGIFQIGDLGCLHLLHVATACGVIHNSDFLAKAHIAKGTTTWKKVTSVFHLGETVLNRMITDLGTELDLPECIIENALCEYCRDNDISKPFDSSEYDDNIGLRTKDNGKVQWPDIFFEDQSVYRLRKAPSKNRIDGMDGRKRATTGNGYQFMSSCWEIIQTKRTIVDGKSSISETIIFPRLLRVDKGKPWLNGASCHKDECSVVKVATNSRLRGEVNPNKKPRTPFKRKKVEHTGLGRHHDLESKLEEMDRRRMQVRYNLLFRMMNIIYCIASILLVNFSLMASKVSDPDYELLREFQQDPTFGYSLKQSIRTSLREKYMFNTRGGRRMSNIISANIDNQTYRRIDLRSLCIAILSKDGKIPSGGLKKQIRKYFRTEAIPLDGEVIDIIGDGDLIDTPQGYTASINYHFNSSLLLDGTDSALSDVGFVRYAKRRAYYRTREDAVNAVIIRTLVKFATKTEGTPRDPAWARRLLPDERSNYADTSFVALYQNAGANDILVGILSFRGRKRVLSIPRRPKDLTAPWQDFLFSEYYKTNN